MVTLNHYLFSRKLSANECRYSTFDRELLAVFASIKKWKEFLHGHNVTVFTDHRPLVGAFNNTKPRFSDRQQRQFSVIAEYINDMVFVAGSDNVVADTFSRLPEPSSSSLGIAMVHETNHASPIDLPGIAARQASTDFDRDSFKAFPLGSQQIFCETSQPTPRPFIPTDLRRSIFHSLHDLSHPGRKASFRLLNTRYFWPKMKADIESWCAECLPCQQCKIGRHTKKPISELPHPTQRFTTVHIDIVGPLTPPDLEQRVRPRYLLTMIDSYSRWIEADPINDISAETVAESFLHSWIARFGPPLTLITDRGTQFRSELMGKLTELLGIHHIRTVAYNARANGMIERVHRSLKTALKARGKYWLDQLPIILFGLRIFPNEDNISPFSTVTGEQPIVPSLALNDMSLKELSIKLHDVIHPFRLPQQRSTSSKPFLPKSLADCTHVWLRLDRVRAPLEAPYQGPYVVVRRAADTFTIIIKSKQEDRPTETGRHESSRFKVIPYDPHPSIGIP